MNILIKANITIGLLLISATLVQAQTGPVANQCRADIAKYCADKSHYDRSVRICLQDHKEKVSETCRQALEMTDGRTGMGAGQHLMSVDEIAVSLTKQGYTEIRKIERERRATYEVKALDPNGVRVELYVDGITGKILRTKRDD